MGAGAGAQAALSAAGGAIVLVVLALTLVLPYLDQKRRVATEVPQPSPLFSVALVEIPATQQACSEEIGLLPGAQVAQMRIGTYGKPAVALTVTYAASGYRESVPVPPRYVNNGLLEVPFTGPGRPLAGSVCVRNDGTHMVALYASADRTKSRSTTTVDGRLWPANFDLSFFAARRHSLIGQAAEIVRRLRLFHAHVGVGLLWALAFLFVSGVPLASVLVVALAARAPRRPSSEASAPR
ncbi:MAG TPA: hypothetical protein VKV16_02455 [Solirubrobacteraceae bacterium]|nr:hypothetical protein [Solirubrobacteraceae bacterium]